MRLQSITMDKGRDSWHLELSKTDTAAIAENDSKSLKAVGFSFPHNPKYRSKICTLVSLESEDIPDAFKT